MNFYKPINSRFNASKPAGGLIRIDCRSANPIGKRFRDDLIEKVKMVS
jgi:hypothetical protein